jgi:hypothetical protein
MQSKASSWDGCAAPQNNVAHLMKRRAIADEAEQTINDKMKVLIAYDRSDHAGSVLDDLRQTGLPPQADAIGRRSMNIGCRCR